MSADAIGDLLRRADRAAGTPPVPADLAERVRRRARRRRSAAAAAASAAAGLAVAAGAALWLARPGPGRDGAAAANAASQAEVARLRAEIERLRAEADSQAAVVQQVLVLMQRQDTRLEELQRLLAGPDPAERVQRQINKAAFTMVYQADRMCRQESLRPSAAETYRRVIELFPQTQWAVVARRRLAEMQPEKGDTS